jgi:hypothetical protein
VAAGNVDTTNISVERADNSQISILFISSIAEPKECHLASKWTIFLGQSYSGRGKYLHNCNLVVIMPKRTWIEPHHALLVSSGLKQNIVEVQVNISDSEESTLGLLEVEEKAQLIAHKVVETIRDRYLTPAAQACYWRWIISGWADVSFVPQPWKI